MLSHRGESVEIIIRRHYTVINLNRKRCHSFGYKSVTGFLVPCAVLGPIYGQRCRGRYSVPSVCETWRLNNISTLRHPATRHCTRATTRTNTAKPTDCTLDRTILQQTYHVSLLNEVYQWNTASNKHINFPQSCRYLGLVLYSRIISCAVGRAVGLTSGVFWPSKWKLK